MEIKRIDYDFSICKVKDYSLVNLGAKYCFIGKTDSESSLVCITEDVPANASERDDGWKAFCIHGILELQVSDVSGRGDCGGRR